MWGSLSAPWRACLVQAWEACIAGTIPIGAAVAGPDMQVLAVGRNRLFGPREASLDYVSGTPVAHAELNALIAFTPGNVDARACTMYTTTEPCPMCAGAIVMAGLRRVCYATRDPWAGSTNLYGLSPYLKTKNIRVEECGVAPFRTVMIALQVEYFLREAWRRGHKPGLVEMLKEVDPVGESLGRRLFEDGRLEPMRRAGCSAEEMLEQMETWFLG